MAPEWEMGMAVDLGLEMAMTASFTSTGSAAVAPLNNAGAATAAGPAAYVNYGSLPPADDFLDFSSLDLSGNSAAADAHFYPATAMEPPAIDAGDFQSQHNSFDLYIPQCEDAAELEWLSLFVDDSFSGEPPYECGASAIVPSSEGKLQAEQPASGRGARSKRSRMSAGTVPPAAWSSMALPQQPPALNSPSSSSSSSSSEFPSSNTKASAVAGKGKRGGDRGAGVECGVRRCTHCASEKTPQWRTGPLGPKTLCNACGVRYKSGRLVPEYRPAASPTFVLTQHSNSHRKVMELRRQKELLVHRRQNTDSAAPRPELLHTDLGVC